MRPCMCPRIAVAATTRWVSNHSCESTGQDAQGRFAGHIEKRANLRPPRGPWLTQGLRAALPSQPRLGLQHGTRWGAVRVPFSPSARSAASQGRLAAPDRLATLARFPTLDRFATPDWLAR